jgi:hypothetical protein
MAGLSSPYSVDERDPRKSTSVKRTVLRGPTPELSRAPKGVGLNELLGRRAGTACNYILPSHLFCQKWCVDLNGRILELLNQFRARRSAYFSRPRACLKNRGHCVPQILVITLQLHKFSRGSSGNGVEDRVAASLERCAGHHRR